MPKPAVSSEDGTTCGFQAPKRRQTRVPASCPREGALLPLRRARLLPVAQPAPGVAARPVVDARDYHGAGGRKKPPFRHDAELQQRAPRGSARRPVAMGSGDV